MEADLAFRGIDFRDYYRPHGGPSRLTLRRLGVLVRHLPSESHLARALGGHGFSMLELLVMEGGIGQFGELNPRHPFLEGERAKKSSRAQLLKDRAAYYSAKSGSLAPVGQDDEHHGDAEQPEREREQEGEHGAPLVAPVGGARDDADDVDGDESEQERVHVATVTPEGGA